jgi:hypothetical protein
LSFLSRDDDGVKRKRSIGSLRAELVAKSREAALSAIRVFNDPHVGFKSETFIVLMVIAWTYLLHAYYRGKSVEYRYFRQGAKRRVFERTKHGAFAAAALPVRLVEVAVGIRRVAQAVHVPDQRRKVDRDAVVQVRATGSSGSAGRIGDVLR